MLTTSIEPAGVMDASYARDRARKEHLVFRLRVRARVVANAVRRHLPDGAPRVLEIGAAEGRTLVEMVSILGPGEYLGVEYNDALRQAAPELPPSVRLIAGDAMRLPDGLTAGHYDVVALLAVLEHLSDPATALREAKRMLRPGGMVVATCPNPIWDALAGSMGMVKDDHHVQQFDLRRLRELIATAGFEVLDAKRFMLAPLAVLPYARCPMSPRLSLAVDRIVARIPLLRSLCVNACVVARRPGETPRECTE